MAIKFKATYDAAKRQQANEEIQERTATAPNIYRLKKNGQPEKRPLEQRHQTWTTREEAEKVCKRMEEMNPGDTYIVAD